MPETDEPDLPQQGDEPDTPEDPGDPPSNGATDPPQSPADHPAQPPYEEVTLADLLEVLWRRRRLVAFTFAVVLLGTLVITAMQDPVYESTATIVPTNERDVLLEVLNSQAFAEDVARKLGWVERYDGNAELAGQAVAARLDARLGNGPVGSKDGAIITITAEGGSARDARDLGMASVETLEGWRGYLRSVTADRVWEKYYEEAGKNATVAEAQVETLVRGIGYYTVLDSPNQRGDRSHPVWGTNLTIGFLSALIAGFIIPFLAEWLVAGRARLRHLSSRFRTDRTEHRGSEL